MEYSTFNQKNTANQKIKNTEKKIACTDIANRIKRPQDLHLEALVHT